MEAPERFNFKLNSILMSSGKPQIEINVMSSLHIFFILNTNCLVWSECKHVRLTCMSVCLCVAFVFSASVLVCFVWCQCFCQQLFPTTGTGVVFLQLCPPYIEKISKMKIKVLGWNQICCYHHEKYIQNRCCSYLNIWTNSNVWAVIAAARPHMMWVWWPYPFHSLQESGTKVEISHQVKNQKCPSLQFLKKNDWFTNEYYQVSYHDLAWQ